MDDYQILDRINALLDSTDPATVNTSMRIPAALRDAAALAARELAAEVQRRHPAAGPEDVLLWAEARTSAAA